MDRVLCAAASYGRECEERHSEIHLCEIRARMEDKMSSEDCYECGGSGVELCYVCEGEGVIACQQCGTEGCIHCSDGFVECDWCEGEGEFECEACGGSGDAADDK